MLFLLHRFLVGGFKVGQRPDLAQWTRHHWFHDLFVGVPAEFNHWNQLNINTRV